MKIGNDHIHALHTAYKANKARVISDERLQQFFSGTQKAVIENNQHEFEQQIISVLNTINLVYKNNQ